MRAILIDPSAETVSEIEVKDYDDLRKQLLSQQGERPLVDRLPIGDSDETLFLCEEGHVYAGNRVWYWRGFGQALAGRGIIVRSMLNPELEEFEYASSDIPLAHVQPTVRWTDLESSGAFGEDTHGVVESGPMAGATLIHKGEPQPRVRT